MFPVLPLRAVIFQGLFLLVAIAIEAFVLQQQLKVPYKRSVDYSIFINLLSTVIGWFVFFNLQPFIPLDIKIRLIFFDQWSGAASWIIPAAFSTFFLGFFIELKGLELLQRLLQIPLPESAPSTNTRSTRYRKGISQTTSQAYVLLVANACSYSAILLLSALYRLIAFGSIVPLSTS